MSWGSFLPDDVNREIQDEVDRYVRKDAMESAEKEAERKADLRHKQEMEAYFKKMNDESFSECKSNLLFLQKLIQEEPLNSFLRIKGGWRLSQYILLKSDGVYRYDDPSIFDGCLIIHLGKEELVEIAPPSLQKDIYGKGYDSYISELRKCTPKKVPEMLRNHFESIHEFKDFINRIFRQVNQGLEQ